MLPSPWSPSCCWGHNKHGGKSHDDALHDTPNNERMVISGSFDHFLDWSDRHRGADAISAGHNSCAQSAMVGEPLQNVACAPAVDRARANSTHRIPDVESGRRVGVAATDPASANQNTADSDDESRLKAVDPGSLRREPARSRKK